MPVTGTFSLSARRRFSADLPEKVSAQGAPRIFFRLSPLKTMKNPAPHRCPARQNRRTGPRRRILATTIAAALAGQFLLAGTARAGGGPDHLGLWHRQLVCPWKLVHERGADFRQRRADQQRRHAESSGAVSANSVWVFNMADVGTVLGDGYLDDSGGPIVGENGTGQFDDPASDDFSGSGTTVRHECSASSVTRPAYWDRDGERTAHLEDGQHQGSLCRHQRHGDVDDPKR